MELTTNHVKTIVEEDAGGGFLSLQVIPNSAIVFIDNQLQKLKSDGSLSIFLLYGDHSYRVEAPGYKAETGTISVVSEDTRTLSVTLQSAQATITFITDMDDAEIWVNNEQRGIGQWTGNLGAGTYIVETRKTGHRPQRVTLTFAEQEKRTVNLVAPIPIVGKLRTESEPSGADVFLDGKLLGQTPGIFKDIPVGNQRIVLRKQGFEEKTEEVTIEEGQITAITVEMTPLPKTRAELAKEKAEERAKAKAEAKLKKEEEDKIKAEEKAKAKEEAKLKKEEKAKAKELEKAKKKEETKTKAEEKAKSKEQAEIKEKPTKGNTPSAIPYYYKKNLAFYTDAHYQLGTPSAAGIALGAYFKGIHAEVAYDFPIASPVPLYWTFFGDSGLASDPIRQEYKTTSLFCGSLGYGFVFALRLRLTPRVGAGLLTIIAEAPSFPSARYQQTYVFSGTASLRAEYALTPYLSVNLTPTYTLPIQRGVIAELLSAHSSTIERWNNGFSLRAGISFNF